MTVPEAAELHFDNRIRVGLSDVAVGATAHWEGDTLIVRQTVQNLTTAPLSFEAFCQPEGQARIEGAFIDVLPKELRAQTYRFEAARGAVKAALWVGLREIDGLRTLDQLVPVPEAEQENSKASGR